VLMASWKSFYDGNGKTSVHMICAIVMNISNLVLCYILVFGKFGAPAMGVNGAGWAAVLSASFGFLLMLLFSLRADQRERFHWLSLSNLDRGVAASLAKLSFFSGVATVIVMTGFALFLKIPALLDQKTGAEGTNAAAAWDVITIMMVVFMTCIAFGTSTATLVAQSVGAKKYNLATRYGWQSVGLIVVVMGVLGMIVSLTPELLMGLFLPQEDGKSELPKHAAVDAAVPSLRFTGFVAPIAAAALVFTQALYGAGESRFVMIVEGALHLTVLVPLAYLLAVVMELGLIGCWYATAVYGLLLLAATGIRFARGKWHHSNL
jgi:multidrug resistance protein, MATE family